MNEANAATREYLDFYTSIPFAPRFAVLISGKWGCGKTWLVTNYFTRPRPTELKFLYISLYGVTSFEDIENQFFAALHPVLAGTALGITAKIGGKVLSAVGEALLRTTLDPSSLAKEAKTLLANAKGRVLIFDDLERCRMNLGDVLGYINQFVEHADYKVILVGNEEELLATGQSNDRDAYKRIREKLIGKTFRAVPEWESATRSFIHQCHDDTIAGFFDSNMDIIHDVYTLSGYDNLRMVRNAILDFARLLPLLKPRHMECRELMRLLLAQFLAYSFEVQPGRVSAGAIGSVGDEYVEARIARQRGEEGKQGEGETVLEKYASVHLEMPLVSEDFWNRFFGSGYIDQVALERSLDHSPFFYNENTPDWQKLLNLWGLQENEFRQLYESVRRDWDERKLSTTEAVVQVAGVFAFIAANGLCNLKLDDVLRESLEYVDILASKGELLKVADQWDRWLEDESAVTRSNWGKNIQEFDGFFKYLRRKIAQSVIDALPGAAEKLLCAMVDDIDQFMRWLSLTNSADNKYYNKPILSRVDPAAFVAALFDMPRSNWGIVGSVLKKRYEHDVFAKALAEELAWLETVVKLLRTRTADLSGTLDGIRLPRLIGNLEHGLTLLKRANGERVADNPPTPHG